MGLEAVPCVLRSAANGGNSSSYCTIGFLIRPSTSSTSNTTGQTVCLSFHKFLISQKQEKKRNAGCYCAFYYILYTYSDRLSYLRNIYNCGYYITSYISHCHKKLVANHGNLSV